MLLPLVGRGGERVGWDGLRELPLPLPLPLALVLLLLRLFSPLLSLSVRLGLPMRTEESIIHVAPAFWHLSHGALGSGLRMHRSFWPRHLSHASC